MQTARETYIESAPYTNGEWHHSDNDTPSDAIAPGGTVLLDKRTGEVHTKAEIAARKGWLQLGEYHAWLRDFSEGVDRYNSIGYGRKLPVMATVKKRIGVSCSDGPEQP
jgi:hypothetical protein